MDQDDRRPEDAGTSPDLKKLNDDSIIIPVRVPIYYVNKRDIDIHAWLNILGGAQKSTQSLLRPKEAYAYIRGMYSLAIELPGNDQF